MIRYPTCHYMRFSTGTGTVYLASGNIADLDTYVLGLPDPDPLVRGTDPAPDPSIFK